MSKHEITLLPPVDCTDVQLKQFHEQVLSGKQVQEEGLPERIASVEVVYKRKIRQFVKGTVDLDAVLVMGIKCQP